MAQALSETPGLDCASSAAPMPPEVAGPRTARTTGPPRTAGLGEPPNSVASGRLSDHAHAALAAAAEPGAVEPGLAAGSAGSAATAGSAGSAASAGPAAVQSDPETPVSPPSPQSQPPSRGNVSNQVLDVSTGGRENLGREHPSISIHQPAKLLGFLLHGAKEHFMAMAFSDSSSSFAEPIPKESASKDGSKCPSSSIVRHQSAEVFEADHVCAGKVGQCVPQPEVSVQLST
ncbi:hypothetical protein JCM33374_g6615 [Metschnikowia sp. JCM 33374]|nr:hypothetical protein JCM33374_g6615 [Metschnikowia sp. JCM 33374]